MITFKFESLTRDGIGYVYKSGDTPSYFYQNSGGYVSHNIYEYKTYGDGNTQHSFESLTLACYFLDCMSSFGSFLINHPEVANEVFDGIFLSPQTTRDDINFFKGLIYDADKTVFYSKDLHKKSSSESKRHDKRFEKIPDYADGSNDSIFQFLICGYMDMTQRIMLIEEIREETRSYYEDIKRWTGFDQSEWNNLSTCLNVVIRLRHSYQSLKYARRSLECLEHNWISRQNKMSEAA